MKPWKKPPTSTTNPGFRPLGRSEWVEFGRLPLSYAGLGISHLGEGHWKDSQAETEIFPGMCWGGSLHLAGPHQLGGRQRPGWSLGVGFYITIWKSMAGYVYLVGGLEHEFYCSIYWEFHHPNWRTHIFQRGWNHQPDIYICIYIYISGLSVWLIGTLVVHLTLAFPTWIQQLRPQRKASMCLVEKNNMIIM